MKFIAVVATVDQHSIEPKMLEVVRTVFFACVALEANLLGKPAFECVHSLDMCKDCMTKHLIKTGQTAVARCTCPKVCLLMSQPKIALWECHDRHLDRDLYINIIM